jgi:AcrR family transcriptional regulator
VVGSWAVDTQTSVRLNSDSKMNPDSSLSATRAQRRRQDALARVLQSATKLFAKNGFTETAMASIANEADVSVGTLYNLFESKEDLYRELVIGKAKHFHTRLAGAMSADGSARESLDRYLEAHRDLVVEEAEFIRLYFADNAQARFSLRASLPDEARAIYEDGLQRLSEVLERGAATREFRLPSTSYRTAVYCQSVITELLSLHADDPTSHPAETVFEEVRRFVYRSLLVADASEPPGRNSA